jgi:small-conductance mechanosensitive channel
LNCSWGPECDDDEEEAPKKGKAPVKKGKVEDDDDEDDDMADAATKTSYVAPLLFIVAGLLFCIAGFSEGRGTAESAIIGGAGAVLIAVGVTLIREDGK